MKYVSITFDDGRLDNYTQAFPVMSRFQLSGTLYCTTGFIDHSWSKKTDWYSASVPLSPQQMQDMYNNGWEIAVHGDKHTTDFFDWEIAKNKLMKWGLCAETVGASLPDSLVDISKLEMIIKNGQVMYIRKGRNRDTRLLSSKILFGMYSYAKSQAAYNAFNTPSIISLTKIERYGLPSVVVRFQDDPQMLINFIDNCPEDHWIIFMFHSILEPNDLLYGTDPWNWSLNNFTKLCEYLARNKETVRTETVMEMITKYGMMGSRDDYVHI